MSKTQLSQEQEDYLTSLKQSNQFNAEQMNEILIGLEYGLSGEQVKLYADPKFTADQMEQIRNDLEPPAPELEM